MRQSEPVLAAGACGGRISRQSAWASGAIMEESCTGSGVTTGDPFGAGFSVARR